MSSGYLRYPHVHGEQLTFVADNDIWLGSTTGGLASRITADRVPVRSPFFSPNGENIAYSSSVNGGFDLYVYSASGTARLTWWGDPKLTVVAWLDDDHVVVSADHGQPQRGVTNLYSVGFDGTIERLPYGPAMGLAISSSGSIAVNSPNHRDAPFWKRYRGGEASQLWLNPTGKGKWIRVLPDETAGLSQPGWVGDRLIFSSDLATGGARLGTQQAQLCSVSAQGKDLQIHTNHTAAQGYVRNPTTDGNTVVFHARGVLYKMAGLNAKPEVINVETGLGAPRPLQLSPSKRMSAIVPDHGGDGSLIEWYGGAYFLTHRSGPARALSVLPGVRIREPQLLGKSGQAVWVSDAEGEDVLEMMPTDDGQKDPVRFAAGKLGRVLKLVSNNAGDRVAVGSHDGRLLLVDVPTGKVRELGRSPEGEVVDVVFSPDDRFLVWRESLRSEGAVGRLMLADLNALKSAPIQLTKGQFNDFSPAFSADGRFLSFLSNRTLDPTYDDHGFDLGFRDSIRPWVAPLRGDEPSPFGPTADGWALSVDEGDDGESDEVEAEPKKPRRVSFDFDGFEDRIEVYPVPGGLYEKLSSAKDGVLWLSKARVGELGSGLATFGDEPPKSCAQFYSFTKRAVETVVPACSSFAVSGDGSKLVVLDGDAIWVQPSDSKPGADSPERVKVDTSRLRAEVQPRDMWRQMFDETGRLMASHFWREDMSGVDWAGVLERYRPIVERLATKDDLVDLLWEVVAELNTSHAYIIPEPENGPRQGHLGIKVSRNSKGEFVIDEILPGESSDPAARSPMRAAGVGAQPGDVISAIDGRSAAEASALGQLLVGSAGKPVEVTLVRGRMSRRVAVVPIADEKPLRYHAWVASRAAYVEEHSAGRLGYVHIPDMMAVGWAEFHRQIALASAHEGVVVDVRFNGGGHTSQLVLERLMRRVLGWSFARHFTTPETYPLEAMRGPVVLVTNGYAGSDGDIICAAAQNAGLGPVVGQRSWSGVIGIDGMFNLVDGTIVTQPRYAFAFNKQGFGVENHGVDPDIVVAYGPAEWEAEADAQLDRAIAEALKQLKKTPAASPPEFEPPKFG